MDQIRCSKSLFFFRAIVYALYLAMVVKSYGFSHWKKTTHSPYYRKVFMSTPNAEDDEFDSQEFNDALRSLGPVWGKKLKPADQDIIDGMRKEQAAREGAEHIYREYPFQNTSLPILPDCNNYYSGKFEEYFWHQNADQVYVYIPIEDSVSKRDIDVRFAALHVAVKINGKEEISFDCLERIIPDGSFWVIEEDKSGKKYLQLDLEKRFRMINWKSLFGEAVKEDVDAIEKRSEMLEKLFAANKGMGKLTGKAPESIEEMENNAAIRKMLNSEVNTNPTVIDAEYEDIEPDNSRQE